MVPTRDRSGHGLTTMGRARQCPPRFRAFVSVCLHLPGGPGPALGEAQSLLEEAFAPTHGIPWDHTTCESNHGLATRHLINNRAAPAN